MAAIQDEINRIKKSAEVVMEKLALAKVQQINTSAILKTEQASFISSQRIARAQQGGGVLAAARVEHRDVGVGTRDLEDEAAARRAEYDALVVERARLQERLKDLPDNAAYMTMLFQKRNKLLRSRQEQQLQELRRKLEGKEKQLQLLMADGSAMSK